MWAAGVNREELIVERSHDPRRHELQLQTRCASCMWDYFKKEVVISNYYEIMDYANPKKEAAALLALK